MTNRLPQLAALAALGASCVFFGSLPGAAQEEEEQVQTNAEIYYATAHDVSPPLRSMAVVATPQGLRAAIPLHRRPVRPSAATSTAAAYDTVTQELPMPLVGSTNGLGFNGIGDRDAVAPPDTNASVGSTQILETVNTSYQVYSKSTGASLLGPREISSVFTGLSGVCGSAANSFSDPVVLYDKRANRWLITIVASSDLFTTGVECIAVSKTSDATGAYNRYSFSFGSNLPDYPKFGAWPDAYYASYNIFHLCLQLGIQRGESLRLQPEQHVERGHGYGSVLPAHLPHAGRFFVLAIGPRWLDGSGHWDAEFLSGAVVIHHFAPV